MFNVLLQVLDDGRITDSQGRTVDFKNTVIIMTSNIGSRHLLEGLDSGEIKESTREAVMADLRSSFRPEFLNRVDETILFKPLALEEIEKIVDCSWPTSTSGSPSGASRSRSTRRRRNGWRTRVTTRSSVPARSSVSCSATSRPQLARAIIAGEVAEDSKVSFKVKDDQLVLGK